MPSMSMQNLILSVGTHHKNRPLSPYEVGQHIVYFRQKLGSEVLHDRIGIDNSTSQKFVKLLALDPTVAELVSFGRTPGGLSFSAAAELARISDPVNQRTVARRAIERQMTKEELRQTVQILQRSRRTPESVLDEVLGMRTEVEVMQVFLGTVTDFDVTHALAEMTQVQRSEIFERVLRHVAVPIATGRLQPETFSLLLPGQLPKGALEQLEGDINDALAREVSADLA